MSFIAALVLFSAAAAPAHAHNVFDIDGASETLRVHEGRASGVEKWPATIRSALKTIQNEMLLAVKSKRNWLLKRHFEGGNKYFDDLKAFEKWDVNVNREYERGLGSYLSLVLGGRKGPKIDPSFFQGKDEVAGPADCSIGKAKTGSIRIRSKHFETNGFIDDKKILEWIRRQTIAKRQEDEKPHNRYFGLFQLVTWECVDEDKDFYDNATTIPWEKIDQTRKTSIGTVFDKTFKMGAAAKYISVFKTANSAGEIGPVTGVGVAKLPEADGESSLIPKDDAVDCTLTDPIGDYKGTHASSDLVLATIRKNALQSNLEVAVYANGQIPKIDGNSSIAYAIGFDNGRGGTDPLNPYNGSDTLYYVDINSGGISTFGEKYSIDNKRVQTDWKPKNAERLPNGVKFTLKWPDDWRDDEIPPLRVYSSAVYGEDVEIDLMLNEGMKKCF